MISVHTYLYCPNNKTIGGATKSAGDIYAPVGGEIIEVNEALPDDPAKVNGSPFEDGWLFKLKMSNPSELDDLLDAAGYAAEIS